MRPLSAHGRVAHFDCVCGNKVEIGTIKVAGKMDVWNGAGAKWMLSRAGAAVLNPTHSGWRRVPDNDNRYQLVDTIGMRSILQIYLNYQSLY